MDTKRLIAVSVLASAALTGGVAAAGDADDPGPPGMGWRHPMMGGAPHMGRQSMGDMHGCPMGQMGMGMLPPGNEKIAMQMHREMMKAMGDILLKYADKIQVPATAPEPAAPAK